MSQPNQPSEVDSTFVADVDHHLRIKCHWYSADASRMAKAIADVCDERAAQQRKWGEQNHDPFLYLAVLHEETGELAKAALQTRFGGKDGGLDRMREEAVQVAAVALAIVETLDRKRWAWGAHALPPKGELFS